MNSTQILGLTLTDFATDELSGMVEPVPLSITYGRLAELLDQAEQIHQVREQRPSYGVVSQRQTKKRERPSSPVV